MWLPSDFNEKWEATLAAKAAEEVGCGGDAGSPPDCTASAQQTVAVGAEPASSRPVLDDLSPSLPTLPSSQSFTHAHGTRHTYDTCTTPNATTSQLAFLARRRTSSNLAHWPLPTRGAGGHPANDDRGGQDGDGGVGEAAGSAAREQGTVGPADSTTTCSNAKATRRGPTDNPRLPSPPRGHQRRDLAAAPCADRSRPLPLFVFARHSQTSQNRQEEQVVLEDIEREMDPENGNPWERVVKLVEIKVWQRGLRLGGAHGARLGTAGD